MGRGLREEKRTDSNFTKRTTTRIWQEVPAPGNPYLAAGCRCHGYDLLEILASREYSFTDVVFLLFKGELPTRPQSELLQALFIAFINPGPRHPATRAAMNAGIGKTETCHILPIGLTVLGGSHGGGREVEDSMRFIRKNRKSSPADLLAALPGVTADPVNGDRWFGAGFGSRFGGIDPLPNRIADFLITREGSGEHLRWGGSAATLLKVHNMGWLTAGVVAATLCDLGFHPRNGAGIYQLLAAPGLLAHGLEMANKPITAMPFVDGENYVIAEEAKCRRD